MRCLFVYLYCNLGGVTSVIKHRLPYLQRAGWTVDAAFMSDFGGSADLRKHGVENLWTAPTDFEALIQHLLQGRKYSVVTIIDVPAILPAVAATGANVIYEVHTPLEKSIAGLRHETLAQCAACLVPSDWSRRWLSRCLGNVPEDRVHVLPNLIDETVFFPDESRMPASSERPMLLWVGKVSPYKRWRDAVRILGEVSARSQVSPLVITGGTELQRTAKLDFLAELESCGLTGEARWLHNTSLSQVAGLYREAAASGGLMLSTSQAESFCLVVHEAIRSGLPVVSSAVGPISDLLHNVAGDSLFEIGDSTRAVELIAKHLDDPTGYEALRRGQRSALVDFEPEQIMQSYLDILRNTGRGR